MVAHQAKWHKTCMLQYNNTMLRRAEKRPIASSSAFGSSDDVPGKRTRSLSSEATTNDASCFFCGESGTETLHGVATYQVDTRVRKCAAQVGDDGLLARLSMGDMVALEAKYHSKCLLALYYRAKTTVDAEPKTDHEGVMSRIVLAELRGNPPRRGHRPSLQTHRSCKAIHDKKGTSLGCFVQES